MDKFIHQIIDSAELITPETAERLHDLAKKADRLKLRDQADQIFALVFAIKKSLTKINTHFKSIKPIIETLELAEANGAENIISEMRFEKSFPNQKLQAQ